MDINVCLNVDIDECAVAMASGSSLCMIANEECINTAGSFTCDCQAGFRRDPSSSACLGVRARVYLVTNHAPILCIHISMTATSSLDLAFDWNTSGISKIQKNGVSLFILLFFVQWTHFVCVDKVFFTIACSKKNLSMNCTALTSTNKCDSLNELWIITHLIYASAVKIKTCIVFD